MHMARMGTLLDQTCAVFEWESMYWCNLQLYSGNMHTCASRITVPTLSLFHLGVFHWGRGAGSHQAGQSCEPTNPLPPVHSTRDSSYDACCGIKRNMSMQST